MTRISLHYSFYETNVEPMIIIAVCALFTFLILDAPITIPLVLSAAGIAGVVLLVSWLLQPGDPRPEVWRFRDTLVVRDRGIVERVSLADCVRVTESFPMRCRHKITLTLCEPTEFGNEISFFAHDGNHYLFPRKPSLTPLWSMSPFAEDLISRIEEAKRNRDDN